MSYLPIVTETIRQSKNASSNPASKIIVNLLNKYCFSENSAITPIPVKEVVKELEKLNTIFPNRRLAKSSPKASLKRKSKKKRCSNGTRRNNKGKCVPKK